MVSNSQNSQFLKVKHVKYYLDIQSFAAHLCTAAFRTILPNQVDKLVHYCRLRHVQEAVVTLLFPFLHLSERPKLQLDGLFKNRRVL